MGKPKIEHFNGEQMRMNENDEHEEDDDPSQVEDKHAWTNPSGIWLKINKKGQVNSTRFSRYLLEDQLLSSNQRWMRWNSLVCVPMVPK